MENPVFDNAPTKRPPLFRLIGAMVYDALIVAAILFAGTALLLVFTHGKAITPGNLAYQLFLLLLVMIYFSTAWTLGGQTIGMRAWSLKLIHMEPNTPITLGQSVIRFFAAWGAILTGGLGFIWLLWDKHHQTWHDKLAKTLIVVSPTIPKQKQQKLG